LLAIPFFILAGTIMERGGIASRIVDLAQALVGWIPGSLYGVSTVTGTGFAAISGSGSADTAAISSMMIPQMRKRNYDIDVGAALIAAAGSLAPIIPPSIFMIVIATLVFAAVTLSVTSAFSTEEPGGGRPATAPQITTDSVPSAIVGEEYRLILSVRGGDGAYTWSMPDGALPQGLELDGGGVVHGVPARPQTAQAKVEVTDGAGRTAQRDLVFDARPAGRADTAVRAPRIAPKVTLLDDAVAGRDYRHVFRPDQGDPPYTWRITGAPPRGLRFAPDGTLAGRPAEAETAAFTARGGVHRLPQRGDRLPLRRRHLLRRTPGEGRRRPR
ncbi:MAG: TRAP transporter large permease subunit, partial [Actinomadura sp.]